MTVTVGVQPDALVLEPGSQAQVTVGVTNASDVVEHYEATVLGLPFGVAAISDPPTTKLRPGEQGTITLTIELNRKPPPAATSTVLGVLVTSPYRHQVSRCEELRLQVTPISGLTAKALPEMANGARVNYRFEVVNPGNTPLIIALSGEDAERVTQLTFDPYELYVPPGGTASTLVTASARRPWTGFPVRREIVLTARSAESEATSTVTLMQNARIHPTVMRVVGVIMALLIMAFIMFGVAKMINNNNNQLEGNKSAIAAESSEKIAAREAQRDLAVAEEERKASEAAAAASLSAAILSASGAERAAAQSSLDALNASSAAAAASAASLSAAIESSSAAAAMSIASVSAASASAASVAAASSASISAASASAASASAAAASSMAAVPPTVVDVTGAPPGLPATYVGAVAENAYSPLRISAIPGQVTGDCASTQTVSRMSRPELSFFLAPGTVDSTGNGSCMNVPVRIAFPAPVREVKVTLLATGVKVTGSTGDKGGVVTTLSTGQVGYILEVEGVSTPVQQVATAGQSVTLGYTVPAGGQLIGAVRISAMPAAPDAPVIVLKSVSYKA